MERILKKTLPSGKFHRVSPERSLLMGKVRSKGNATTERRLRLALVRAGLAGWKMHAPVLGCPDFFFEKQKLAVFVDGCFWHYCKRCGHVPNTRELYWRTKFERNRQRSKFVERQLQKDGIRVVRFWEHDVKRRADKLTRRIIGLLAV
jgi:DNA mismatch endonuclease, patch repair protein